MSWYTLLKHHRSNGCLQLSLSWTQLVPLKPEQVYRYKVIHYRERIKKK
jgi:hypothetical protein